MPADASAIVASRSTSAAGSSGGAPSTSTSSATSRPAAVRRPQPRRLARVVLLVGVDDALHELVAHDVLAAEANEVDALEPLEDLGHDDEPRVLVAREVDLRDVARDDHPGAVAKTREEHLHLLGRGVLRLVEDDEAVVERAAAHEGQR